MCVHICNAFVFWWIRMFILFSVSFFSRCVVVHCHSVQRKKQFKAIDNFDVGACTTRTILFHRLYFGVWTYNRFICKNYCLGKETERKREKVEDWFRHSFICSLRKFVVHDYKNVRNGNYYHYQMVSNISGRHQALCSNSSSSSIALIHTSKTIHKYWILLLALKKYSLRRYSVYVWVYSSLYMVVRVV